MSANLSETPTAVPDAIISSTDVPSGDSSPPATGETQTAAPGGNGDVEAGSTDSGEAAAPAFSVPETDDDLKDLQGQQHVEALIQTRNHARALGKDLDQLKPLATWQPLTEKYSDVAEVQTNLDLLDALSSPVLENGQPVYDEDQLPVTTAAPFISQLFAKSPARGQQLVDAALDFKLRAQDGTVDTAGNWYLRERGIDPADIDKYTEWKKQGAPVASIDLAGVPEKYHQVLKQLPAYIQEDRLAMPEEARNWQLEQDLNAYQGRLAQEASQTQQKAEFERGISQAAEKAVDGKFQEGFDQFLTDISSWQPTADPGINKVYHLETASSLVNLLDARMSRANQMLFEAAGISPDPEIVQLNESFQRNTVLAERYAANNARNGNAYAREQAEAQKSADRDYLRLTTKIGHIAKQLIEYKTKVASAEAGAEEAANLQSRPTVAGAPAGENGNRGPKPDWYKDFVRTGT